jgi:hypothetical protein
MAKRAKLWRVYVWGAVQSEPEWYQSRTDADRAGTRLAVQRGACGYDTWTADAVRIGGRWYELGEPIEPVPPASTTSRHIDGTESVLVARGR